MMLYHDGLRTIAAEMARHSSIFRATHTDFSLLFYLCRYETDILFRSILDSMRLLEKVSKPADFVFLDETFEKNIN